ncbi:MAG: hypothetical protein QOI63_741 [Thermoplasmata archaeon]|jgi:hypothetical protein|nr:hypothetical protein [Thermoplasmata archaeon]
MSDSKNDNASPRTACEHLTDFECQCPKPERPCDHMVPWGCLCPDLACLDCGRDIPPMEVHACDRDCKSDPLCESCYEDNHAEGGCLLETEAGEGEPAPPPDLDTGADRLDQADMAWTDDAEALHG